MSAASAPSSLPLWSGVFGATLVAAIDVAGVALTELGYGRASLLGFGFAFFWASFACFTLVLVPLLSLAALLRRLVARGLLRCGPLRQRPRATALLAAAFDALPFFVVLAWVPQSWLRPRLSGFGAGELLGLGMAFALALCTTVAVAWAYEHAASARARRGVSVGLVLLGAGAWLADRFVLQGLYPNFHYGAAFLWITATVLLVARVGWVRRAAKRFGRRGWFVYAAALAIAVSVELGGKELHLARGSLAFERLATAGRLVLDFDGDGAAAWLGGLDCEEFSSDRSPGAFDVPGDGIDQDCTGSDARWELARRAALPEPKPVAAPPSVVLITVDALRADHLGAYGHSRATSPNIDALAARSLRFARAVSPSPKTYDTMPGLMTGLFPSNLPRDYESRPDSEWAGVGEYAYVLGDVPTLAERFGKAGYRTAAWVGATLLERLGLGRGFERFEITDEPTEPALEFLAEPSARPLFLWLHYYSPHAPYEPHAAHDFGSRPVDRYDGEIAHEDARIGRVLAAIEASRPSRQTVIVLTADHGEEFGDHGGQYHGLRLYRELIFVPLLLHVPGTPPGVRSDAVSLVDVAPTLCELAGIAEGCGEQDGRSLLAPLGPERTPAYSEVWRKGRGIVLTSLVTERFHLIRDLLEQRVELYDLSKDPREHHNQVHRARARTRELLERQAHAPLATQAEIFASFARDGDALALAEALPMLQRDDLVLQAFELLHPPRSEAVALSIAAYAERHGVSRRVRARARELFGGSSGLAHDQAR